MKFPIKNFKLGNVFRNVSSKVKTSNVNSLISDISKVNGLLEPLSKSNDLDEIEKGLNNVCINYKNTKDVSGGVSKKTGPTTAVVVMYNECISELKQSATNNNFYVKYKFLNQDKSGLKKYLKKYIKDNYGETWHASILNSKVLDELCTLNNNIKAVKENIKTLSNAAQEVDGAASVSVVNRSEEDKSKSEKNSSARKSSSLKELKMPEGPLPATPGENSIAKPASGGIKKSDSKSHSDAAAQSPIGKEMAKVSHSNEEPVKAPQHHVEGGAKHTNDKSGGSKESDLNSQTEKKVGGQEKQNDRNTDLFDEALNSLNSGAPVNSVATEAITYDDTMKMLDDFGRETAAPRQTTPPKPEQTTNHTTGAPAGENVGAASPTTNPNPQSQPQSKSTPSAAASAGEKGVTPKQATNLKPKQTTNHTTGGSGNIMNLVKMHNETITNESGAPASLNRGATLPQQHHRPLPHLSQEKGKSATLNRVPTTSSEKEKTLLQNFGKATKIINNIKNIKEKSKDLETICNLVRTGIIPYVTDESTSELYNDIAKAVSYYREYAKLDDSALFNNYVNLGMIIDKFKDNMEYISENAQNAQDLVDGLIKLYKKIPPLNSSEKEKILSNSFKKMADSIKEINGIKDIKKAIYSQDICEKLETIYSQIRNTAPCAVDKRMQDLCWYISRTLYYYMNYAYLGEVNTYRTLCVCISKLEEGGKFRKKWGAIPEIARDLVDGLIELYEKISPPLLKREIEKQQLNHVSGSNGSAQTRTRPRMPLPTQGRVLPPNPSPSSMGKATHQTPSGQVMPLVDASPAPAPQTPSAPPVPARQSVPQTPSAPAAPQTRPPVAPAPQTSSTPAAPPAPSTPETPSSVNSNSEIPPAPPAPPAPQAPQAPAAPSAPSSTTVRMVGGGNHANLMNEIQKGTVLRKSTPKTDEQHDGKEKNKDGDINTQMLNSVADIIKRRRAAIAGNNVDDDDSDDGQWSD